MEQVTAYKCWGVYADYKANAPDTANLCYFATAELAQHACDLLNAETHKEEGRHLAYSEGHEWCKRYKFQTVLLEDVSMVWEDFDLFTAWLEEQ